MHRIIKKHLESFVASFSLGADDEAKQFEKFATYSVISNRFSTNFELDDVVTGDADEGLDGIAIVIDETVITSREEAEATFASQRRNHDVDIVFIQAKRSHNFDLGDFLKFKEGIFRFISPNEYTATDDILIESRNIFDMVLDNVPKLKDGKPSLIVRFVTTGIYQQPKALETALKEFKAQANSFGIFHEIDIKFIDRDELTKLWVSTYSGVNARLPTFSAAALPSIVGIDEAYLAVVRASDFVNNVLTTDEGNLRTQVFEENVRAFLGLENPVNQSIAATLISDASSRFPVLNNGITIVSPDVQLQGSILHITNFQIVNGCQTSNVLFKNRDNLNDVMVNIKVVETQLEDVFSELVRATNSQTKIENNQFISLRPIVRKIEQYFNTYDGLENRLYLERRERQYVGQDIPNTRIFSLHNATKCVASMLCHRPDLASRYTKAMYEELTDIIFADDTKEILFYAACLTMYRFTLLVSNSTIQQNLKRFKWHILPVVWSIINNKSIPKLNSRQTERQAQTLIDIIGQHGTKTNEIFYQVQDICNRLGTVTSDRLKRQTILQEMLSMI